MLSLHTAVCSLSVPIRPNNASSTTSCTKHLKTRTFYRVGAAPRTVTVYFTEEGVCIEAQPKENIVEVPYPSPHCQWPSTGLYWCYTMRSAVLSNGMDIQVAERAGVCIETGCNSGSCGICEVSCCRLHPLCTAEIAHTSHPKVVHLICRLKSGNSGREA